MRACGDEDGREHWRVRSFACQLLEHPGALLGRRLRWRCRAHHRIPEAQNRQCLCCRTGTASAPFCPAGGEEVRSRRDVGKRRENVESDDVVKRASTLPPLGFQPHLVIHSLPRANSSGLDMPIPARHPLIVPAHCLFRLRESPFCHSSQAQAPHSGIPRPRSPVPLLHSTAGTTRLNVVVVWLEVCLGLYVLFLEYYLYSGSALQRLDVSCPVSGFKTALTTSHSCAGACRLSSVEKGRKSRKPQLPHSRIRTEVSMAAAGSRCESEPTQFF